MTSSFPIATVFNVVKEIQTQIQLTKANRALCKRIGSEMDALEVCEEGDELWIRREILIRVEFSSPFLLFFILY